MSHHHSWQLVANPQEEQKLLDAAVEECLSLNEQNTGGSHARLAILYAYGTYMYCGLQERRDRAGEEMCLAFTRVCLARGLAVHEAEEIAQETMLRVYRQLHTMYSPKSVISWSLRVCATVRQEHNTHQLQQQLVTLHENDEVVYDVPDQVDMFERLERDIVLQQVLEALKRIALNNLERVVMLRVIACGDQPVDVARELNLPPYQLRIAKHRALKKVRQDKTCMQLLRELAGVNSEDDLLQPQRDDTASIDAGENQL